MNIFGRNERTLLLSSFASSKIKEKKREERKIERKKERKNEWMNERKNERSIYTVVELYSILQLGHHLGVFVFVFTPFVWFIPKRSESILRISLPLSFVDLLLL